MQEEECDNMGQALVDIQAYYVLYPKLKQIVNISDGNSQILGMAMEAMHEMYSMVLVEAVGKRSNHKENSSSISTEGRKLFTSSSLALDVYAKITRGSHPLENGAIRMISKAY
jgi:hypothetical protein